jgi:hypothetical protein
MKLTLLTALAVVAGCSGSGATDNKPIGAEGLELRHTNTCVFGDPKHECPPSWTAEPVVDPSIMVSADGGGVLLHAAATGTQNYVCESIADGGTAWTFVGPEADLIDYRGVLIGHHFASEGGSAAPEWQLDDGTFVIGHKLAQFVPDGGAASIPWLLLEAVDHSDGGVLAEATYVQRLNTNGGIAPTSGCDVDAGVAKVSYSADYYIYGP